MVDDAEARARLTLGNEIIELHAEKRGGRIVVAPEQQIGHQPTFQPDEELILVFQQFRQKARVQEPSSFIFAIAILFFGNSVIFCFISIQALVTCWVAGIMLVGPARGFERARLVRLS